MNRNIITKRDIQKYRNKDNNFISTFESETAIKLESDYLPDNYTSKLLKYIPAEVIALFLFLDSIVSSIQNNEIISWIVFVFCLLGTYFYAFRILKIEKKSQIFISLIGFCVWAFALGGPFENLNWYINNEYLRGIVLPMYTFLIPIFKTY